jgi:hypothetical protein
MPVRRPKLTVARILAWADAHHARTNRWPRINDPDRDSLPHGETWQRVHSALRRGWRGRSGADSLPGLLARERGARSNKHQPRLTARQALRWADDHRRRTGRWPTCCCGAVPAAPGHTWAGIDQAMRSSHRGFAGGDTLSRLPRRNGRGGRRGRWTNAEGGG